MPLYQHSAQQLHLIHEQPFALEKELQTIIEVNLDTLMDLTLVKSEFSIKNKRIDSLAWDEQTKGFVIIEYKRDRNMSVVDQGFSYLSLMLENKAEFIAEYNESLSQHLKRDEVDWSQSRVVFVAPSFTENQKLATNFQDIAIELWEVKRYDQGLVNFVPIRKTSKESIKQVAGKESKIEQISQEIKVYTEEDHLVSCSERILELYEQIKSKILSWDDIELYPTKLYIGFKLNNRVITDIGFQKNHIKQHINLKVGQLDDPKNLFYDISTKGHWGVGDYEARFDDDVDVDYLISLVRQSYLFHRERTV